MESTKTIRTARPPHPLPMLGSEQLAVIRVGRANVLTTQRLAEMAAPKTEGHPMLTRVCLCLAIWQTFCDSAGLTPSAVLATTGNVA